MEEQEAVKHFLTDVVGYGKVTQLLEGKKPLGESVMHFLRRTVIGTYGKDITPYDMSKGNLPVIPRISRAKGSQEGLNGFEYEIKIAGAFYRWTPKRIAEFVKKSLLERFPECSLSKKDMDLADFRVGASDGGLELSVSGCLSGIEQRVFSAHFNLPPEPVEGINGEVFQYLQARGLPFPEPLKLFSKKEIESLSAEPVVDASLLPLVKKGNGKLLKSIRVRRPPLYDGGTYTEGSLMAHLYFGFGIVTGVNGRMASVYFPQHSETKNLLCSKELVIS